MGLILILLLWQEFSWEASGAFRWAKFNTSSAQIGRKLEVIAPKQDTGVLQTKYDKKKPFSYYRNQIAKHESQYGKHRTNVNENGTVDLGYFHINSIHLNGDGEVGRAFDKIFKKWGVTKTQRVEAVMYNDKLNEELAKKLYELRGLKSWTSSRKFIKK